jgi:hypothetical protein
MGLPLLLRNKDSEFQCHEHRGENSAQELGEHNGLDASRSTSSVQQRPMSIPAYTVRTLLSTRKNLAYGTGLSVPLGVYTTAVFGDSVVHIVGRKFAGFHIYTTTKKEHGDGS